MKTRAACIPCIMKQAYNTALRVTSDESVIKEVLSRTVDYIKTLDFDKSPADSSNFAYRAVTEVTGVRDPYRDDKRKINDLCLSLLPGLKKAIDESPDPLYTSFRAALFGNLIDLGIGQQFDITEGIKKLFDEKFAIDDYPVFREIIDMGRRNILYLGDNAGEIVFDRLVIEKLCDNHQVTYVVKNGPIINDATLEDAHQVGMDDVVDVIGTGSDGIGIRWDRVSATFVERYRNADIIISKGQGNFETMDGKDGTIFFLLRAKCDSVAEELGVYFGDIVFKKQ